MITSYYFIYYVIWLPALIRHIIALKTMMDYNSMTLSWETTCTFAFQDWTTNSSGTFFLGCVVSMLIALLFMALPKIKKEIEAFLLAKDRKPAQECKPSTECRPTVECQAIKGNGQVCKNELTKPTQVRIKQKIILVIYSFIYAFLHVFIMLVLMQLNGYVILAMIIGFTAGFSLISGPPSPSKSEAVQLRLFS